MCDTTALLPSKETDLHSCWIIYTKSDGKEHLTVTDAKPITMADQSTRSSSETDVVELDEDEDNGQSWHEMLDPELQPEQPIPNNAESQEIYREHERLAKEYLKVDTSLYYAQDFKEKFLMQMDPAERQEKQELLKKMSEKEELLELYNNLKQQLESLYSAQNTTDDGQLPMNSLSNGTNEAVPDDSWVVIGPRPSA